jgi:membrane protein YqaA with SNARE-associated domain
MRATLHKIAEALLAYGPWGVFVLAIIDSIGVPLPAAIDGLLIGVAASSAHSPQTAYFTALLAVIGSAGGNAALFLMARQGNRLISKGGPPPGKRKRFREWFQRYGLLTVFLPAIVPFLPLPLKVFVISAGAFHTPFGRFMAVILVARSIRYFSLAYLGLQLGLDAKGFLTHNGWTITGVALVMTFLLVLVMRGLDRRRSEVHN